MSVNPLSLSLIVNLTALHISCTLHRVDPTTHAGPSSLQSNRTKPNDAHDLSVVLAYIGSDDRADAVPPHRTVSVNPLSLSC